MKNLQKTKRYMSMILVFLLILGLVPTSFFATSEVYAVETPSGVLEGTDGNITWKLTEEDPSKWDLGNLTPYKLTLSGSGDMKNYSMGRAPWAGYAPYIYEVAIGEGITSIGSYAFYNCVSITAVSLPNSVSSIGERAFYNCYELKTVNGGSSLASIGRYAFCQTTSLESVGLSGTRLTSIGANAFYNSYLKSISLPSSMISIGESAFYGSNLQTVTLPSSITSIGNSAFRDCTYLKSISALSNVTSIGEDAFYDCYTLPSIDLGSRLETIGNSAFSSCISLSSITMPNSVTTIDSFAFSGCSRLNTVGLGSGLKTIGSSAFSSCSSLSSLALPAGLTTIGAYAFSGTKLSTITIPGNVSSIGYGILYNCSGLQNIEVAGGNSAFGVIENALYEKRNNTPYRAIAYTYAVSTDQYTIADGTEFIDQYAFYGSKIKELTLPDSVKSLAVCSFANSSSLTSVSIGKNVSIIPTGLNGAFLNCSKLGTITTPSEEGYYKAVDNVLYNRDMTALCFYAFAKTDVEFHMPDTVTQINGYAIYCVPNLKELYLPENLKTLSNYAISGNGKLKSIYFAGGMPSSASKSSVSSNANDLLLFRLKGTEAWTGNWTAFNFTEWDPQDDKVYQGETEGFSWKYESFNGRLTLTGSKLALPDYSDTDLPPWYPYMKDIRTIEASAQEIGDYAFYGAERLRRLSTDSAPTRIGDFAFADCPKLVYLTFNNFADIGADAFSGDASLNGTMYLYNVSSMGARAFKNCSSLKNVYFSTTSSYSSTTSKLTALEEEAFSGCTSLATLTLPKGLVSMASNAFLNCASLGTLILPAGLTSIGSGAFQGCVKLASLDIPNGVTSIEEGTLEGCAALKSVILPANVISIGANALKGCTSLTRIDIPETVSAIGAGAFSGAVSLEGAYFKGAFPESMDDTAFADCSKTTLFYFSQKDTDEHWASLGGFWNERPVKALDHFFTEGKDHYSFSNSSASFGYDSAYRIPRQRYVDVLDSILTGTYYYSINKSWGGSCYGMASTALEFYENINNNQKFDLKNFSSSVKSVYEIAAPNDPGNEFGNDLRKLIEAYQISQYQPQISSCSGEIIRNMNNYKGLRERIMAFQSTGGLAIDPKATPVVIAVYSLFGGHALVPVSWEQTDSGDFEVKVYDCNMPKELQTLTINREMNSFEYGFYNMAISFVDYTAIAAGMSGVQLYSAEEDSSLYLSVDKASGSVTDGSGNGIDKIKGAYEQKPFTADDEDVFSGIRSYVLPDGSYTIAAETSGEETGEEVEKDITFYMASDDVFAEVTASDENMALSVDSSDTAEDKVALNLSAGENAKEDESVSITLMSDTGIEREIEITGYENENIQVNVDQEDSISVSVPETAEVLVDHMPAEIENGEVSFLFVSGERENPFKIKTLETEAVCDDKNKLRGSVSANLIYASKDALENAVLVAEYYDKENHLVASYTQQQDLNPGLNFVELPFENLKTSFKQAEGEADIHCRLTVTDQEYFSNSAISGDVTVSLTKQSSSEPDTEEPGTEEPGTEEPGTEEPGTEEPGTEKPGTEEPGTEKPGTEEPGTEKPGTEEPGTEKPSTQEPNTEKPNTQTGQENENPPAEGSGSQTKEDIPVTGISVSPSSITIGIGETCQATAKITPANATNQALTFMASNKKITVNKKGKITGKKTGTSWVIVRTANGQKASMKVKVKKAPKKISLNAKKKELKKGESFKIKVKLPKNTASHKITFSSNKKSVAKVNSSGKVTAMKQGSAVITVKAFNGKKAKLKITVK